MYADMGVQQLNGESPHEDRCKNRPLGRTGGYKNVDKGAEENKSNTQRNTCEADVLQEVSAADG